MTAKTAPYPACHRDYFVAKAPGQVTGWLRQVTLTPSTAGPLTIIRRNSDYSATRTTSNLGYRDKTTFCRL
jgi:hypothetical protein